MRDLNELKAVTRAGMGACGGKTCPSLIKRLFREEGVPDSQITDLTKRPVFMEVPLGAFAGVAADGAPPDDAPGQARDRRARRRPVMSTDTFDVVIVGAGSVGLPTALFLAEQGIKPLVIDQFASAGQGSNKAAIGGIRATHSSPAKIHLCLESLRDLLDLGGDATATTSSGPRAATRSSPTARRKSGR